MIIILALLLTVALAAIGIACVRAYAVSRPGGFGSGAAGPTGRGYGRSDLYPAVGSPSTLFGGRRWALLGCYTVLTLIIVSLVVLDGILVFVISVARS
ncbi:MAG: hypothetical protein ABR564_01840 [Candidatus Dormibacteria bacterium]